MLCVMRIQYTGTKLPYWNWQSPKSSYTLKQNEHIFKWIINRQQFTQRIKDGGSEYKENWLHDFYMKFVSMWQMCMTLFWCLSSANLSYIQRCNIISIPKVNNFTIIRYRSDLHFIIFDVASSVVWVRKHAQIDGKHWT